MSVKAAATAGAWSTVDVVARQGITFLVSVVLSRLLAPEDFGLIALLSFFSGLSIVFVQGGLSLALVQRQSTTRDEESAVFWFNLLAGLILAVLLVVVSPFVAAFYGYPLLRDLMWVAAAQIVFSSLGAVQAALLTRELRFRALMVVGLASSALSGIAGIGAALAGWGVWALAAQLLSSAALSSVGFWLVSAWRPLVVFRLSALKDLYRFGFSISLSSSLELVYSQGFSLLVAKQHGAADLGLFNRALSTQVMPATILSTIMSRVALPLFSARADDPAALKRGLQMSLRAAMLLSLPMIAGLALLADLVLLCLFGPQWTPAAKVLTILALGGALLPYHVLNLQLLLALGRSKEFLGIELKKKLSGISFVVVGSFFGIEGLAYSLVVGSIVSFALNAAPTKRLIDYSLSAQLWDVRDTILATGLMALVVALARPRLDLAPWPELIILSAIGAAAYFSIGFILRLPSFMEAWQLGRLVLDKKDRRDGLNGDVVSDR